MARGWLVLELSNSSFWLGMVGFAASFPFLLFTLFGGVIADRVSKRHLLLGTQTVQMIFAFALAFLTYFKIITIGQLALLAFLNGISNALNAPAYQALVPRLVPREDLPNAIALNSAQFNMSRIVGPTLGGYAMAYMGVAGNFFLNGFSFLAVLWPLHRMRYPPEKRQHHASMLRSLHDGIAYVRRSPEMSAIVMLIASASLFLLPFITFVPYFAKDVLGAGARGLGFLMACSGIGALLAAVVNCLLRQDTLARTRDRFLWTVCDDGSDCLLLFAHLCVVGGDVVLRRLWHDHQPVDRERDHAAAFKRRNARTRDEHLCNKFSWVAAGWMPDYW